MSDRAGWRPRDGEAPATSGLLAAAALALALPALHALRYAWAVITGYPFHLDREEGFLWNQARLLAAGEPIFVTLTDYPYIAQTYPPVFSFLWSLLVRAGLDSLATGRAMVLAAAVCIVAAAGWLVWRSTGRLAAAVLAPMLFLVTWNWNNWLPFARVDIPAIAFGLGGFVVLTGGTARWRLPVAIGLFLLAFFTKQTQLLAPAAGLATLLWQRRWRDAGWFAGGLAGAALLVMAALQLATGGQYWRHNVLFNANVMEWWQLRVWGRHMLRFSGEKMLAAMLALPLLWSLRHEQPAAIGVAVWLLLSTISFVQIAKVGSAANYLLEPDLLIAIAAAMGAGAIVGPTGPRWQRVVQGGVVVALLATAWLEWTPLRAPARHPFPMATGGEDAVLTRVITTEGEVLSEPPVFALLAGRPVLYQSFILRQLSAEGKWDASAFENDLRGGRWALLVTSERLETDGPEIGWSRSMKAAATEAYLLDQEIRGWGEVWYLYRRRGE